MLRSPLLSNTQAARDACDALVRPYGNGALSTCSRVKLPPTQTTGRMLPRLTTKNWTNFFNTVAHYRGRAIVRLMDSVESGRQRPFVLPVSSHCGQRLGVRKLDAIMLGT